MRSARVIPSSVERAGERAAEFQKMEQRVSTSSFPELKTIFDELTSRGWSFDTQRAEKMEAVIDLVEQCLLRGIRTANMGGDDGLFMNLIIDATENEKEVYFTLICAHNGNVYVYGERHIPEDLWTTFETRAKPIVRS